MSEINRPGDDEADSRWRADPDRGHGRRARPRGGLQPEAGGLPGGLRRPEGAPRGPAPKLDLTPS